MVLLRPETDRDLPDTSGGLSPFDDFGPRTPRTAPSEADLDEDGRLLVEDDAGQVVGGVSWLWTRWGPNAGSRCVMIGIWLRPESRGQGLGTAAQRALVDLLFRHTTTYRVEAATDLANVAEQRSLEKVGFRREGVLRGSQWRDGVYHDTVLFGILRPDWAGAT